MAAFPTWQGADGQTHQYYMKTTPYTAFPPDSQMGHGCIAVKRELKYNGFSIDKFDPESPLLGTQADQLIKMFQGAKGLTVDGQAGPNTCKALFVKRCRETQDFYRIPDDLVAKLLQLESGWDPAARGNVDPRDRGLAQINSGAHPEVTDVQADDPAFAVDWTCKSLRNTYNSLLDWDATLAAHNVGTFYAKKWLDAGKPASGVFTTGGKDIAVIATKYVALVRGQDYAPTSA